MMATTSDGQNRDLHCFGQKNSLGLYHRMSEGAGSCGLGIIALGYNRGIEKCYTCYKKSNSLSYFSKPSPQASLQAFSHLCIEEGNVYRG